MVANRYAVLDGENVVNVILWDDADEYEASGTRTLLLAPDYVAPGWQWVNGAWVPPTPVPAEPLPMEDPDVTAAKVSAMEELKTLGVSEANARVITGLPPA